MSDHDFFVGYAIIGHVFERDGIRVRVTSYDEARKRYRVKYLGRRGWTTRSGFELLNFWTIAEPAES